MIYWQLECLSADLRFNEGTVLDFEFEQLIRFQKDINETWGDRDIPEDIAELFSIARFDLQLELLTHLRELVRDFSDDTPRINILFAWVNLGALVEGTLRWFFCVHVSSVGNGDSANAHIERIRCKEIEDWKLGEFVEFFNSEVMPNSEFDQSVSDWLTTVMQQRNNIHTFFRKMEILGLMDLISAVSQYVEFSKALRSRQPSW